MVTAWISQNVFDGITYTVRNGLNKGLRWRGGLGWVPREHAPTPELLFWKDLNPKGKVVYDVGAFQGIPTSFFTRSAAAVVAWEPNSRNRARIEENLRLNGFHPYARVRHREAGA
jgi:hypothetical protein